MSIVSARTFRSSDFERSPAAVINSPSLADSVVVADTQRCPLSAKQSESLTVVEAGGNRSRGYLVTRRLMDIAGAVIALALFSPILLVTFVVLMITTKGNPIFRQQRVGLCGRRFTLYKFRTMQLAAESLQHLVKNERQGPVFKNRVDPRITGFGRFLEHFQS